MFRLQMVPEENSFRHVFEKNFIIYCFHWSKKLQKLLYFFRSEIQARRVKIDGEACFQIFQIIVIHANKKETGNCTCKNPLCVSLKFTVRQPPRSHSCVLRKASRARVVFFFRGFLSMVFYVTLFNIVHLKFIMWFYSLNQ